jgi:hypothetical protein
VDATVADGRLEGWRGPQIDRVDRLHIVMAVDQDGWSPWSLQPFPVDQGVTVSWDDLGLDAEKG